MGCRQDAAHLTARLMTAVIQNLKKQHAFFRAYHAETGAGIGERNTVQGLAPLGLFLETLGSRDPIAYTAYPDRKEPISMASYGKI